MTRLLAVRGALPPHRYAQADITEAFLDQCVGDDAGQRALTRRLHASSLVEHRHLAYPLDDYVKFDTFARANDAYIDAAVELGARAVSDALAAAGLSATDVDVIVSTTVTGVAVPSLEMRVARMLGMRDDVVRVPLFGLGCAGGVGGLARLDELLSGRPGAVGVLMAVELCSLTTQRGHTAVPHLVASALFGDGAAAVVATSGDAPGTASRTASVRSTRSRWYPDSERAMGWDIGEWGLRIVLDAEVPALVEEYLVGDVDALLVQSDLTRDDIDPWICHPGGPKVLTAVEDGLGLHDGELSKTWASLANVGNLSSASVLQVLEHTLAQDPPTGGRHALMLAMGPGFASELALLDW